MQTDSLTYKTLKNVSYSFFGYGWSLLFTIFITPIIVFKLGVDKYGVFIFINTVASLLGLLDVGFSTAVSKYVSEYHGEKNETKLKRIIYSSNFIFLVGSIVGLFIFIFIGLISKNFVSDIIISNYNLPLLFFISGLVAFVNGINSIYTIIPNALQRFDISTKISIFYTTLSSLTMLILIILGFDLEVIFLSQFILSILYTFIIKHFSQKILPVAKFIIKWDKDEIIKCYKFGLVSYISTLSSEALTHFDKLIIPILSGPSALSYYSLSNSAASKSVGTINSLTSIILPMTSSLNGSNEIDKIKKLYIKSTRLIIVLGSAIAFAIAIFSYKIMQFWLDETFAINTYKTLIILASTYFILTLYKPINGFLLGLGKTKLLAKTSVVMAIMNIILVIALVPKFGIFGAAIAYFISVIPILYTIYYFEKNILLLENRITYYLKLILKILSTAIIFYLISKYFIEQYIVSFKTLLVIGPLSVLFYIILYRIFNFFEKDDLNLIKDFYYLSLKKMK